VNKIVDHIDEKKREFSVTGQIKHNMEGRAEAINNIAHGNIAILGAVAEGAQTVLEITEFAVSGGTNELDRTKLAKDAAIDVYNNTAFGLEQLEKAAKVTYAGATITNEKMNEIKTAQADLTELCTDGAVVSLSTGAVIGGALDTAGSIVPHPAAKIGLKGLGILFKFSGIAHGAEELENMANKKKELESHQLTNGLQSEVKRINQKRRDDILLQAGGFT